jgi:NADH dehydrogenase
MITRTVAVTGAHGYAGSHIVAALERLGHRVVELVRRPRPDSPRLQILFELGRGAEPGALADARVDALVHIAWDARQTRLEDIRTVNRGGAVRLFDAFQAAGGTTGLFISTMSAFEGCRSNYGRVKLEVEREALGRGFWAVRSGLIQGPTPGGMVGQPMLKLLRRLPVVPVVGYGKRVLNPVTSEELSHCVAHLVERPPADQDEALVLVAHRRRVSIDDIVRDLASKAGLRRRLLLPVPWQPVWLVLRILESAGLSVGLRSDSVISLMNQDPDPPIRPRPWFTPDPPEGSGLSRDVADRGTVLRS